MENKFNEDLISPSYILHTPNEKNNNYISKVITSSSEIQFQPIIFDMLQIESSLRTNGKYEDEISIFTYYKNSEINKNNNKQNNYLTKIISSFSYYGILSTELKKNEFGSYYYENQDQYIGQWNNDLKDGNGIYFYYNQKNLEEFYIGKWKNGKKNGKGIYFWKFSDSSIKFDNSDYDIIYGNFENDIFLNGYSISKNEKGFFVYFGKFDKGKKNDENAFFFEKNMGFIGKFENDGLIEGRVVLFKEKNNNQIQQSYFTSKSNDINNDKFILNDDKEKNELICIKRNEIIKKNFHENFSLIYLYSKELLKIFLNDDLNIIYTINIKNDIINKIENFIQI